MRPLFTYLMIFDLIIGFLWGMLLFLITNLAGVTGRRVDVRYRRDAEPPVEPMPTVFGEWRIWNGTYFRSLALPVFFPPPEDPFEYVPREPRTRLGRYTNRQRATIRAEFAARGHGLPDLRAPGRPGPCSRPQFPAQ